MLTCKSTRRCVRCDRPLSSAQFLADAAGRLRELATAAEATGRLSGCAQSVADLLEEAATGICTWCLNDIGTKRAADAAAEEQSRTAAVEGR